MSREEKATAQGMHTISLSAEGFATADNIK